jgi:hypothetical protein
MDVALAPSRVNTGTRDEDGFLIYADGKLTGILVRLDDSCHEPEMRARWFLEAAFGPLSTTEAIHFNSPAEATEWVTRKLRN